MIAMMAQPSRVGDLLAGKYRLDALLGSGGVGEVYRAQNTMMGRTVAIKILKPEHVTDGAVVARFMREAKAANLARHPNVVDVLDVGLDDDGVPFIVQEFLEGVDLGKHLKRSKGALGYKQVLELMIPVVEAVGLAHAQGVVHRDIKPENVFLAKVGDTVVPKLLDFGISYIKPQPGDVRMTRTGMTVGTPAYMSPEQLEGTSGVDVRTDVWALGVILYEALSGHLPFEGETSALLFAQIAWVDPVPLQKIAPQVPEALAQVVSKCLRRKVQERYASATELARDLRRVRQGKTLDIEPAAKLTGSMPSPCVSTPRARPAQDLIVPVAEPIEPPQVTNKSGLALATLPPPKPDPMPSSPPENVWQDWACGAAVVVEVLCVTGLWMAVVHQPEGWPVHAWLVSSVGGIRSAFGWMFGIAGLGLGAWLIIRHISQPTRYWGWLVMAAGLLLVALPLAGAIFSSAPTDAKAPVLWGWGLAIAACGVGLSAVQQAWVTWRSGQAVSKGLGCAWVAAATLAFLSAFEMIRALSA